MLDAKREIGLAPMEGTTDFPTRLWFALVSRPAVVTSPFLRVTESYPHRAFQMDDEWPELGYASGCLPYQFTPQMMAADPVHFVRAAEQVLSAGAAVVELNCGCPAPKVVGHGAGSSLLRDQDLFQKTLTTIIDKLGSDRFRVKMRSGFLDEAEFSGLLDRLASLRLARLTLHARTRTQQYSGLANWQLIQQATDRLDYPVCGSGDIVDVASLRERVVALANQSPVIIGRGALRNPWIFSELGDTAAAQKPLALRRAVIECYAILNHAWHCESAKLRALVAEAFFKRQPLCVNIEAWQDLNQQLHTRLQSRDLRGQWTQSSQRILGRVKMMWRYLCAGALQPERSSILALRSHSLEDFFSAIELQ
jgi:tRNA-dihydrouridine synthase